MLKTFKTIDEQIEILKNKGLVVDDYDFANDILLRENYFFLSGYRHLFMKSERDRTYLPGTTFRELYGMFSFDRHMRNIVFKYLLIVENNAKSIFSYVLSKNYGIKEKDYLDPKNFNRDPERSRQVNDLIKKMKRQIRINGRQHSATSHYLDNYGYVPLWIVVKVLSFGIVSELFSILKTSDQQEIADLYGIAANDLLVYLPLLANFRNLCAHEDIMYDHKTQRRIDNTRYHHRLNIPMMDGEYVYGKDDLFALVIILKRLLTKYNFNLFLNEVEYEISILEGKLTAIGIDKVLDKIGFPKNYKEIVGMNENGN